MAQYLKTFQPQFPLRPRTRTLIEDFVGTRAKKYADITARVILLERNKARKNKGIKRREVK